jgi:RNA polymerase sigma factor (sigma-70 family)
MSEYDPHGPAGEAPSDGDLRAASDPELISLVRAGDAAAYEELFLRHREVALRYARRLVSAERAEDLTAEAFTKILDLLQRGKGPEVAFRAYLLTTVRTSHLNTLRTGHREDLVPDHEPTGTLRAEDDPDQRFDRGAVVRAFSQLPERWQAVLWMSTVEGLSNEDIGARLGIKPNAVASLGFRARSGLRQAFLAEHVLLSTTPVCRTVLALLPGRLRGTLSERQQDDVDRHLATCRTCTAAALELSEVDTRLGALLLPLGLTVGTVVAGVPVGAGTVGAMLGSLKVALATVATQVKAWASGAPWVVGAKVTLAATVAAAGVAVGAKALDHHPQVAAKDTAGTLGGAPRPTGTVGGPGDPTPLPGSLPTLIPGSTATDGATVLPPTTSPTTGSPTATPTTSESPTAQPTKHPTPTPTSDTPATEAPAARSMAVSQVRSAKRSGGISWSRVSVEVSDVVQGTKLLITSTRTGKATIVSYPGWACGTPKVVNASSSTSCTYVLEEPGNGTVLLDVQGLKGGRATAQITPPPGVEDASKSDNVGSAALVF